MDDRHMDLHAAPRPGGLTRRLAIASVAAGLLVAARFGVGSLDEEASARRRVRNRRRNRNSNRTKESSISIPGQPGEDGEPGEP